MHRIGVYPYPISPRNAYPDNPWCRSRRKRHQIARMLYVCRLNGPMRDLQITAVSREMRQRREMIRDAANVSPTFVRLTSSCLLDRKNLQPFEAYRAACLTWPAYLVTIGVQISVIARSIDGVFVWNVALDCRNVDISRESRSQAPVRRSTTQQRHLLPFPYTAICRQKKTSTLDPSGAGSQSLRISLPKRFWPLIGAHVALLNGSQIVRNRRYWVCSKEPRAGRPCRPRPSPPPTIDAPANRRPGPSPPPHAAAPARRRPRQSP